MNSFYSIKFAVRQLETAAQVNENDETLSGINLLHDIAQRFEGAADLAREHHDLVSACFFRSLHITLRNIAHDPTDWHIVPEMFAAIKLEANKIGDPELPF